MGYLFCFVLFVFSFLSSFIFLFFPFSSPSLFYSLGMNGIPASTQVTPFFWAFSIYFNILPIFSKKGEERKTLHCLP